MKLRTICLLLGAGLLAGCWQKSLNAFYTSNDVVFDEKLVRTWHEKKENAGEKGQIWTFTEGAEKGYRLEFKNNDETLHYEAHLFKLDEQRLLDIVSIDQAVSTIPAHHLFKVIDIGTNLQVSMLNIDWTQKWLRKNPTSLAHIVVIDPEHRSDREKDELVLTADTKALQAFLREHWNDADLFTGTVVFEPSRNETATKK